MSRNKPSGQSYEHEVRIPRDLPDLAIAMARPMGHQEADKLLVEALQSLIFRRTLNPQQRDAVLAMLNAYRMKLTREGQLTLFGEGE